MHPRSVRLIAAFFGLLPCFTLAQNPPEADPQVKAEAAAISEALSFRTDIAARVAGGTEQPEDAIKRIKAHARPAGALNRPDTSVALATIDVGQRLIASGQPAGAEAFFKEAETSLESALKQIPDVQAREKSMLLTKLALVQANFLNKPAAAKAALDAAHLLTPDDSYLQAFRGSVANERSEFFKPKEPKK